MGGFRDATHLFVHAAPGAFRSEEDRLRVCVQPEWTAHVGTTDAESRRILETSRFLDGAIVLIDRDPAVSWPLVWAFIERFPRMPIIAVSDVQDGDELIRAASRGVTVWPAATFVASALYLLKHRLHDGVYHHVCRLLLEHQLPIRQFQCLLLAAEGIAHKAIAERLGIAVASVRSHLQHAVRTTGGDSVEELLTRIRIDARAEAKKGPLPPRGS